MKKEGTLASRDDFWSYYKNFYTIYTALKILIEVVIIVLMAIRLSKFFQDDICPGLEISHDDHDPEVHLNACAVILLLIHAYDCLRMSYMIYIRRK
jgi:hypothetical protein